MSKRSASLTHRKQRSVLTDMLPFEVPPTFSNRGFYRFLRDNHVEFEGATLRWKAAGVALDTAICLLFGIKDETVLDSVNVTEWGATTTRRLAPINACRMDTIPFNFRVA